MDFSSIQAIVSHYLPFWILGICMIISTLNSEYKDMLRIQPKSLAMFIKRMVLITIYRLIVMHFFPPSPVDPVLSIPVGLTATVFWEDAVFTMPLAIASMILGDGWISKIIMGLLTVMVMISFGSGHLYQGAFSAAFISLYIPVVVKLGKKHGFGTVMLCHMLYDFVTIMTIKLFLGS